MFDTFGNVVEMVLRQSTPHLHWMMLQSSREDEIMSRRMGPGCIVLVSINDWDRVIAANNDSQRRNVFRPEPCTVVAVVLLGTPVNL